MEMVSASKMKKAQDQALGSRPFTEKLEEMLENISGQLSNYTHPLMEKREEVKCVAALTVSTNKGLCGGLNVTLFRELIKWSEIQKPSSSIKLINIGKKAKGKIPGKETELLAKFNELSENPTFEETRAISRMVMEEFINGTYDEVYVIYPKFISTLRSDMVVKKLLPLSERDVEEAKKGDYNSEYLVEPSPKSLLDTLLPYQLEMSIYQVIIEARASEHSARMVAMKSASDNASELIDNLTLDYNQARQSQVTNALLDVTSARMALKE